MCIPKNVTQGNQQQLNNKRVSKNKQSQKVLKLGKILWIKVTIKIYGPSILQTKQMHILGFKCVYKHTLCVYKSMYMQKNSYA